MTTSKAFLRLRGDGPARTSTMLIITMRTSWMTNNTIPDSIIMNMICRSLVPPIELNEPNVRSAEEALTSKNTLRILSTVKPVTKAFETMDATKPVRASVFPQGAIRVSSSSIVFALSDASQTARGNKFNSAYQMKIY